MQEYKQLDPTQALKDSIPALQKSLDSAASGFSGTAFPTENLFVGMRCVRTDQNMEYVCTAINSGVATWTPTIKLSLNPGQAETDGSGNNIEATYLKKSDASNTYVSKTDATSTYLTKTAAAENYFPKTTGDSLSQDVASNVQTVKTLQTTVSSNSSAIQSNQTAISELKEKVENINVKPSATDVGNLQFTFTGSTQGSVTQSGSVSVAGDARVTVKLNNTLTMSPGVSAGTKTLKAVLQDLISKSHTHSANNISFAGGTHNCNCACCFIKGTLVTMADGSKKSINKIIPGDKVIGMNGYINTVKGIHHVKLGNQRFMMTFDDKSLIFTGDHVFRIRSNFDNEAWGTSDISGFIREHSSIHNNVYSIRGAFEYFTENGWKVQIPVVAREYGDDTDCFDLILDGDSTYYANGYLVKAYTEDF